MIFGDSCHIGEWMPGDWARGRDDAYKGEEYKFGGGLFWIWEVEEIEDFHGQ